MLSDFPEAKERGEAGCDGCSLRVHSHLETSVVRGSFPHEDTFQYDKGG